MQRSEVAAAPGVVSFGALTQGAAALLEERAATAGVELAAGKTAAFLRDDVMIAVAPLASLYEASADAIRGATAGTLVGVAYVCAPCGPDRAVDGAIASDFYRIALRPAGGDDGTAPRVDLILRSDSVEHVFSGGFQWVDDTAAAAADSTRVDLAVHGDEPGAGGEPSGRLVVTIRVWLELSKWRGCWEKTIVIIA